MPKNNVDKIKEIYDKLSTPEEKVLDLLEQINKEKLKGDDGKTPVKGEDYFTEEEISEFLKFVTPKKGKDYFDGKTPTDEEIIALIKPFVPEPIPGKDGSIITPEEVRDKLKELKGKERLSVFDLKDIEWVKGKNGEHIQWSSAGFKIFTDTTLTGDGSQNNPLHAIVPTPDLSAYSTKAVADTLYKPIGYAPDLSAYAHINQTTNPDTFVGTFTFPQIIDSGLTASLGVYTDTNKQLTSTPPASGTLGYWSRTGTTISTATAGDNISTTGKISIGASSPTGQFQAQNTASTYNVPGFFLNGLGQDSASDSTSTTYGFGLYLTHNTSGNRQFSFVDTETNIGIRLIGNGIDGYNLGTHVRMILNLGNADYGVMTSGQFSIGGNPPSVLGAPIGNVGATSSAAARYFTLGYGFASPSFGSHAPAEIGLYETSDSDHTVGNLIFATRAGTTNIAPTLQWSIIGAVTGGLANGDLVSGADGTGTQNIKTAGDIMGATYHVGATAGIDATVTYVDTLLGAKTLTFKKGILTSQV